MSPSLSPAPPTHATIPALHLRDARDAHVVFEAVRLNLLPLITRRLTAAEREHLQPGNVFVWEEAEHKQGGLERWTDGRRWSQSRMRGDYLFYEEKIETTPEEKAAKAARRARRTLDPFNYQPAPTRQDRPSKPDGLTKQTYSTHVYTHPAEPRKWHVVAYFCGDDYTRLPVIEDYDFLRKIRIPEGVFSSPRGNPARAGRVLPANGAGDADWPGSAWPPSSSSSSPSSPSSSPSSSSSSSASSSSSLKLSPIERPESSSSSSSSSSSVTTLSSGSESTVSRHGSRHGGEASGGGGGSHHAHSLPRLSNIVPIHPLSPSISHSHSHGHGHGQTSPGGGAGGGAAGGYAALTNEDRRALSSFRVVL